MGANEAGRWAYERKEAGRANHKRRPQEYLVRCEAREKMTHRGSPEPGAAREWPPRLADVAGPRLPADHAPDPGWLGGERSRPARPSRPSGSGAHDLARATAW